MKKSRRGVWGGDGGKRVEPLRRCSMADGMEGILGQGPLLVRPEGKSVVDEGGKTGLIDWGREMVGNRSGGEVVPEREGGD
jgi:hypothetical protein